MTSLLRLVTFTNLSNNRLYKKLFFTQQASLQLNIRDVVVDVYNEVFKKFHLNVVGLVERSFESCKLKIKHEFKLKADEFMLKSDSNLRIFNDKVR